MLRFRLLIYRKTLTYLIFIIILIGSLLIYNFIRKSDTRSILPNIKQHTEQYVRHTITSNLLDKEYIAKIINKKIERLSKEAIEFHAPRRILFNESVALKLNYNVHIFYYAWYGNLNYDGFYKHWNHTYLPNWKQNEIRFYPTGIHKPQQDIGSNYYPKLGCYSSRDPNIIKIHLKQLRSIGIGVVVISWTPPRFKDSPHNYLDLYFDRAAKLGLKIALHVEPYEGRTPNNLMQHLKTFLDIYANHSALYVIKTSFTDKKFPVFYVYDSYLTPHQEWRDLLDKKSVLTIRGGKYDGIFLGLLGEIAHRSHIRRSHFDGFYTYFATNGFTYGSTWKNWHSLTKFATQNELLFSASVGPGYIDTRIRPWNAPNTRHRRHGQYYEVGWRGAISNSANFISITSFNEWHEGTQIEPAIPKTASGFTYENYQPEGDEFYLNLTRWWIEQYEKSLTND